MARRPIPRPLVLFLHFAAWLFISCARTFTRFVHPIVSVGVLFKVWTECYRYWLSKLNGSWWTAFPVSRTGFVITLVAVPVWGACMAVLMLLWPVGLWTWTRLVRRRLRRRQYEPVTVNLGDLESTRDAAPRRKGVDFGQTKRLGLNTRYFIFWAAYASVALFGVYMLLTYELPIDHRFKSAIELANRVPKPGGYGSGGKYVVRLSAI